MTKTLIEVNVWNVDAYSFATHPAKSFRDAIDKAEEEFIKIGLEKDFDRNFFETIEQPNTQSCAFTDSGRTHTIEIRKRYAG